MADISKRLEKAEKYVQRGKLDAALDEYLAAWKEDPNNDHLVEVIAELYTRQDQLKNALECYGFLFDKYADRNEGPRASVVFRKMAKLGAPDPARMLAFAKFQERQKPDEALEYYRSAAQSFLDRGDAGRAVDALRGVAMLKSEDAEVQTWLGEVAERAGRKDVASQAFVRAGELLRASDDGKERAMELLERAHSLSPNDGAAAQMLAQALMESGNPARAAELLEPFAADKTPDRTQLLAEAHLASGNCARAEELLWELAPTHPAAYQVLQRVSEGYLRRRNPDSAVNLLRRLKKIMFTARKDREFIEHLQSLEKKRLAGQEVLEFLASVYNELNYDSLFHGTQTRLFDLYMEGQQYERAANALDHLVDVDPYDAENSARLQQLAGKVDERRYQALAGRFRHTSSTSAAEAVATRDADEQVATVAAASDGGASSEDDNASLEDLVLQAEIFLQYGLKPRAVERLQKIAKRFPGEEARNDRLRSLYSSAQFSPKGAPASAAAAPVAKPDSAAPTPAEVAEEMQADVTRVAEISRNIYRQGTVKGVLSTSVNEIGKTWHASRCVAGLCTPGKPPSAAMEYCSSTMKQSDVMSIVRVVTTLVQLTSDGNPLSVEDAASSQKLTKLQPVLQALEVKSLLALPMMDSDQPVGVVILEQCDRQRRWRSNEIVVLKSIVDQMVIATSHVKLRSLMKTLAVADERSGILNRNSYLDCLVSECGRGQRQHTPLTVMLLKFSASAARMRELGEEVVGHFMDEATQALVGHLRQNDIGVRYDKLTLALVLPDTKGKDGYFVIEKLRKITSGILLPNGQTLPMSAGIGEAVLQNTDPLDSVTELINRLEFALEAAEEEGPGTAKLL